MRCVIVAAVALGLVQPALAADLGPLRGSFGPAPAYKNWEGFYVGGAVGVGGGGASFGNAGSSLIGAMVANTTFESDGIQNWATAGAADTGHAAQYGAFLGYNAQWDDVVVGLEVSYYHTNLSAGSGGRTPSNGSFVLEPDGSFYAVPTAVSGQSFISLTDFGTLRARFGWAVGPFLPYLTGGGAIGRATYGTTATLYQNRGVCVVADCTGITNPWPSDSVATAFSGKTNALIYGWSAGLGMDWALTDSIFVRAEYEFIQFSQNRLNLNNGRVAAAWKF